MFLSMTNELMPRCKNGNKMRLTHDLTNINIHFERNIGTISFNKFDKTYYAAAHNAKTFSGNNIIGEARPDCVKHTKNILWNFEETSNGIIISLGLDNSLALGVNSQNEVILVSKKNAILWHMY